VINLTSTKSLTICGECLKNTTLNDAASAQEAMCVPVRGEQVLQLARQLTAAALNCVISQPVTPIPSNVCDGLQISSLFVDCNNVCLGNASQFGLSVGDCTSLIDCFNNGGLPDPATNSCSGSSGCHDQPLCNQGLGVCFKDPGPAGSSNQCNAAIDTLCTVVGMHESDCMKDTCP